MSRPMTLEEAVEITRKPRDDHRETPAQRARMTRLHMEGKPSLGATESAYAEWDRAKAIVDQAVKAHKARCAYEDDDGDSYELRDEWLDELEKLRALERGEVQP